MKNKIDFLKEIFDSMPSIIFIVDEDVRIIEYNKAASDFIMMDRDTILKKHGGKILHCTHSGTISDECGTTKFCQTCTIRNSVKSAYNGESVVRARAKLDIIKEGEKSEIYALITTNPFFYHDRKLVLLVIEDISIITELQQMIPICSVCHKIRDKHNVWSRIEAYFKETWDVDFTHGICPDCHKKEMEKLRSR